MSNIGRVNAQLSTMALESSNGAEEDGKRDLKGVKTKRADARQQVAELKEKQLQLQEDLKEAQDKMSGVGGFFRGLFGGDGGLADVTRAMGTTTANMERTQNELELMKAETNGLLKDLQAANEEVGETYQAIEEIANKDNANTDQLLA